VPMRLAMKVVQEWCRLGDQNVVSQRWEPGAVAKKFVATMVQSACMGCNDMGISSGSKARVIVLQSL
jgi:hypothetical protein